MNTQTIVESPPILSGAFPKSERLHHHSLVNRLFREGKSFYEFPLRVSWNTMDHQALQQNFRSMVPEGIGGLQMMITVPKKKRKRAVDRVLMRRRIREAWRLNRGPLAQTVFALPHIRTLSVGLVYIHDRNLDYETIEQKIKLIVKKLISKINQEYHH